MNQFLRAAVTLLFLLAGFQANCALASPNSIRKVQTRAEGSALIVQIEMENDVAANPGTWSIVEPPRIVLDFPETTNKTGSNTESIAMGDIKSLNIVQTDQLTRLVLNLYRTAQYSIDAKGRNVVVRIEPRTSVANSDGSVAAPSRLKVVEATKPQSVLSAQNASVRDIRFQRGEEGQGLLLIGLSDGTVPVDVRREGNLLTVEMPGTELPQRLKARRDVNDFATPVTFVTAKTVGAVARFELAARGKWFHQSRVTNNELAIEIRQIPPDDANKLVQAGQQGQKVSINFFEAEATMVLRTLAEISGKNVMIDPSLAGRRITVALDNIPYDQAIEIVMAQVNAGMRLNDTIVLFGDRTILQKRDQDRADDQTRAADIAQLVSETFELNYVKVADVESLISAVPTQGAAAGTAAPAGQPTQAPTAAAASKGMLSARGSMTKHEPTNKLFVRDTEERVSAIREVIRSIDVPAKQVLIEARIVRADTNFSRALGVRLGYQDLSGTVSGNGIGTRIGKTNAYGAIAGSSADLVTRTGQDVGGGVAVGGVGSGANMINLPMSGSPTGQFAVSIFNSSLTKFINMELQAAETEGRTVNISSPRVVTANNLEAKIERGTKIPYSTSSAQGTNTQFIDATLSLTAKPQIAPNGTVILELTVTNNTPGSGSPPSIQKAELKTKVTVENGGTVVLGGVVTEDVANTESRVPLLSDIPFIGNLFKSTQKITSKGELLVFITPRVLDNTNSISAQ
jgi:type IV pilus assembly protein PilQ